MPKKWVKESLHHDFLTNLFVKSVTWIKNNRENAIIGGFITLVAIVFIPFIISHQASMDIEVMTLVSQGELLSAQGQHEQALSFLNQALQKNRRKTNMLAYYYKGNTLFITGRYQEAIETYNKYLENFKNKKLTPEIMIGLTKAYEQINDFNNSINICNEFINKYPGHPFLPDVFQTLGFCYEASGRKEEAIEIYRKISTIYPGELWQETATARLEALGVPVQ